MRYMRFTGFLFALLVAALLPVVAQAQGEAQASPMEPPAGLEALRFAAEGGPGEERYRLGANAFSAEQLTGFVATMESFLETSASLRDGEILTLRQEGLEGYIALSAYGGDAPHFVLTLKAEPPTGITSPVAVLALGVHIADQLAEAAARR